MPRYAQLPDGLHGASFTRGEAFSQGVTRRRLERMDVARPFHGIYANGVDLSDLAERCLALKHVFREEHWVSHVTAARRWGMPLPYPEFPSEPVHVIALGSHRRLRRGGVVEWETDDAALPRTMLGLIPIISPADVWAQLSMPGALGPHPPMSPEWLVAVGDFILSGPCAVPRRPLATLAELEAALARRQGRRGVKALRWALERVRSPVDSPPETFLRLGLMEHGLPEPEVQPLVRTSAGDRHADLGFLEARLLLEYQGDGHRTSRSQWREDLTRTQLFEDAGYRVIAVTADDLGSGLRALAQRVRRALSGARFAP